MPGSCHALPRWCFSIILACIKQIPPKARAINMRHILRLLLLLFPSDGRLADDVLEYNRAHQLNPALHPFSELVGITNLFIQWYNIYRRRFPPKDEVDIQELTSLGERYKHILHIMHIYHISTCCTYLCFNDLFHVGMAVGGGM